jgi:uncharacterized protein (DUF427 family)
MSDQVQRQTPLYNQESVWDYPRPPRVEPSSKLIRVIFSGQVIAETRAALRVLETSHPPAYYIPPHDIRREFIVAASGHSFCEFKGAASYWSLNVNGKLSKRAAWSYADPAPNFRAIKDYLAFYASRVDECYVDDERVTPQEGDFYGGWITSNIVGPFKGGAGTMGW